MKLPNLSIRWPALFLLACFLPSLWAQEQPRRPRYIPKVGQAGKDVIWVPTPEKLVEKMLWSVQVTPDDFVIDLGSGDGRLVIAAARLGARARGIEFNPDMVELSRKKAAEAGVSDQVEFVQGDIFACDFSDATVITMFLLPSLNLKLRPRLLELKPGTRIVSNAFSMDDWMPDYKATTGKGDSRWNTALVWIVPAKAEGTWKLEDGELTIRQEFQKIYGLYQAYNKTTNITDGRLYGDSITLNINGESYSGHVIGEDRMEGVVTSGTSSREWLAIRAGF